MSRLTRKTLIIIVLFFVFGLGFGFYFLIKNRPVLVKKVEVQNIVVQKTVLASGVLKSKKDIDLSFVTTGRINEIYVKKGQKVKKDQKIASLSNLEQFQNSQSFKDNRDIAIRNRDLYIHQYQNSTQEVGGKDEYNMNIRKLDELVSKAEAEYQSSLATLSQTTLFAPFDGEIIDVYLSQGQISGFNSPIVKIADLEDLYFEAEVDQKDFGYLKQGQKAIILFDLYENHKFKETLESLFTYKKSDIDGFLIEIPISKQESQLPMILGMKGDIEIITDSTQTDVLALPFDFIFEDEKTKYVWINDNGRAKKFVIEIGLEGDIYTQIKTDLKSKEIIVPSKDGILKNKARIKIEA